MNVSGLNDIDWSNVTSQAADAIKSFATAKYGAKVQTAQIKAQNQQLMQSASLAARAANPMAFMPQGYPIGYSGATGYGTSNYSVSTGSSISQYMPLILIAGAGLVLISVLSGGKSKGD